MVGMCIVVYVCIFFFKQKTAYEMRISDWSSDVCSSDLFARNANSKPWPRKGMPTDKDVRQAQFTAQLTHLILEQFAQRFNQLHVHAVGKAANIMMALDRYRWPAGKADAFNDIWVKSALRSEEHTYEIQSLMRISYAVF